MGTSSALSEHFIAVSFSDGAERFGMPKGVLIISRHTLEGKHSMDCNDDINFFDAKGYPCSNYYDARKVLEEADYCSVLRFGYTESEMAEVREHCQRSCGYCPYRPMSKILYAS